MPVLIDAGLGVIAGHGRLLACQELGWTAVPTICLDHLSEAQAKAFMIADNRLSDTSTWDDTLLATQLKELSGLELGFNLEDIGFEIAEIDLRIEGLNAEPNGIDDAADSFAAPSSQPPVSKLGDLWLLGGRRRHRHRHRVICGNALDADAYATLMQGEKAAMVFTDPPYNVPIHGHASGLGKVHHREFMMASGEMTPGEFTDFQIGVCTLLVLYTVDGSIHFVCMDWRHIGELLTAGGRVYSELKNICAWVKHNAGMGSLYRSQHELVAVFKNGRGPHRNNVQLGRFGRHRSNVWNYRAINSFGQSTDEGNLQALHPTVKPVAMVADAILDCSRRGDLVLDPFLGSGTTVIAAERVGRRCYGIEIDPLYVDTIIRRWQTFTGDCARHAISNQSFDETEAERKVDHV